MNGSRREFLQILMKAGAPAAVGLLTGSGCSRAPDPDQVRVARVDALAVGEAVPFRFGRTRALLIQVDRGSYAALASDCSHGACSVQYLASERRLHCPCHNGRFDLRGRPAGGPPTEPIEAFAVEVRDGEVWVSRRPNAS